MKPMLSRLFSLSLVLVPALFLSGCASTFTSTVTVQNQIQDNLNDKRFSLATIAPKNDTPELAHAIEEAKTHLSELGFQYDESASTLQLQLELSSVAGNAHVSIPFTSINYLITPSGMVIPMSPSYDWRFFNGIYAYPGRIYPSAMIRSPFWPSPYSSYFWGRRYNTLMLPEPTVQQSFEHKLTIRLLDPQSGKLVYQTEASSRQSYPDIEEYIELLVESALKDFPSASGKHKVKFKIEK